MRIIERRPAVEADIEPDACFFPIGKDAAGLQPDEGPAYAPLNVTLANTPLKADTILRLLDKHDGKIGLDTEFAGASLRGRDFVNLSYSTGLGISLSFKRRNYYLPIRHKGNNIAFRDLDRVCKVLQDIARENRVYAHNAKAEHFTFTDLGFPLEGLMDTMIAVWLITGKNKGIALKGLVEELFDRKVPPYDPAIIGKCGNDVKFYAGWDSRNALDLAEHFVPQIEEKGLWDWFVEECTFTHTLADMKRQGMRIDYDKLTDLASVAGKEQERILAEWTKLVPDIKITSSKQLQELFLEGTWVPKGRTKSGAAFSTEGKVMEYNAKNGKGDGKRLAQLRLEYQEVAKIVSTYSDELVEEARQWRDGKLHPDLFHFGTVTGRLSSSNPNIQNQPARGTYAKLVREAFIPEEGYAFVSADYSQVELRYFAEYCGGTLLDAFLNGKDLHQRTADAMETSRDNGKTVNFGFMLYGGAPQKLADDVLKCSVSEAEEKIKKLHAEYPEVEQWRQRIINEADNSSPSVPFVHTLAGRIRHIPELNPDYMRQKMPEEYAQLTQKYVKRCRQFGREPKPKGAWYSIRSRGERLVVNYLIQGGARDLLVLGMNHFRRHMPKGWQIVTTVHDEVMVQCPEYQAELASDLLKVALESAGPALGLKVPILAEPKIGYTWAEVK